MERFQVGFIAAALAAFPGSKIWFTFRKVLVPFSSLLDVWPLIDFNIQLLWEDWHWPRKGVASIAVFSCTDFKVVLSLQVWKMTHNAVAFALAAD